MNVFTLQQASGSSSEGNLQMQLNLYTMNLRKYIAAHMETLAIYPALSTAVIIVCVWVLRMCCFGGGHLFLSTKSRGFELFTKSNQACGYTFSLCPSFFLFLVSLCVSLFVYFEVLTPVMADNQLERVCPLFYCLFICNDGCWERSADVTLRCA